MNKNLTEIAYILDRSGSMQSLVEPAISGFNEFLKEQLATPGDARLTLILFDDEYLTPCQGIPLVEATELDTTTYVPRGCTALLDAIGRTMDELGQKLAALPEADRPGEVIVAIFTDGYENASTQYTLQKINEMITHQRKTYHWKFLFLAANQDAIATAGQLGIDRAMSSEVQYSRGGIRSSSRSFSRKISSMRTFSVTGKADPDLYAPLEDIVSEEQEKDEDQE